MEESYILVLLTILILLVVVIGYFGQKKIREMELSTNALKCDFETHTEHVNNILLQQNNTIGGVMSGGNMSCEEVNQSVLHNDDDGKLDLSKIQNIMNDDYTVLNEQNEEIYKNLNSNLKCIDDSDDESLVIENNNELLVDDSDDSDNDNFSSDSEEETLPEYNVISNDSILEEQNNTVLENMEGENMEGGNMETVNMEGGNMETVNMESETIENGNIESENKSKTKSKKRERKVPNKVASKFQIGHQSISENDGKMYKVVEYKSGNNIKKRWVLAK